MKMVIGILGTFQAKDGSFVVEAFEICSTVLSVVGVRRSSCGNSELLLWQRQRGEKQKVVASVTEQLLCLS